MKKKWKGMLLQSEVYSLGLVEKFCQRQCLKLLIPTLICGILCVSASGQEKFQNKDQPPQFKVIGHQSLITGRETLTGSGNAVMVKQQERSNKGANSYKLVVNGAGVSIPALSNIEYAEKANRIVVYGDSPQTHIAGTQYAGIYSGSGTLIKSLGKITSFPFVSALSDDGLFVTAGNISSGGTTSMALICYSKAGVKLWQKAIPNQVPTKVFTDHANKFIALNLFDTDRMTGIIQYYSISGQLLFTDAEHSSVSAIEFLPSGKVVVCTGNMWYLYSMSPAYKLLSSGSLKGNTVGRFPVTADASGDQFLIVTSNGPAGYRLQAFDGQDGSVVAESEFEGEPSWQPYRLASVMPDKSIRLITSRGIITLKMR